MKYKRGYKYQLVEDEVFKTKIIGYSIDTPFIRLTLIGILTAKHGYAWNGANVIPDSKEVLRGSCGHDAGYQLISMGLLPLSERVYVDELLQSCCKEDGAGISYSDMIYQAVRIFGEAFATLTDKILIAP
jgi:hypothetical protein